MEPCRSSTGAATASRAAKAYPWRSAPSTCPQNLNERLPMVSLGRSKWNMSKVTNDRISAQGLGGPTEVTGVSSDTPDMESDTQSDSPAQLPSRPKYPSPERSCGRRGRVLASGHQEREIWVRLQLQHRPYQDFGCSRDKVVLTKKKITRAIGIMILHG